MLVLIHPSQQGFSSWAVFLCCEQIMWVNFCCEQILALSKFDFCDEQSFTVSKLLTINLLIVSNFVSYFISLSNFLVLWAIFLQMSAATWSRWLIQFWASQTWNGNGFSSGRRVYSLIHDLPRIVGPSWWPDCVSLTNSRYTITTVI